MRRIKCVRNRDFIPVNKRKIEIGEGERKEGKRKPRTFGAVERPCIFKGKKNQTFKGKKNQI